MGQGQEGGSVSPHSCFFFSRAFVISTPNTVFFPVQEFGESVFPSRSQFPYPVKNFCIFPNPALNFGQIPDPDDTLPDLDGQQAQNILNHP